MPIRVTCGCGTKYTFKDAVAGRRATCPTCGRVIRIPGEWAVEPAAREPAPHGSSGQPQDKATHPMSRPYRYQDILNAPVLSVQCNQPWQRGGVTDLRFTPDSRRLIWVWNVLPGLRVVEHAPSSPITYPASGIEAWTLAAPAHADVSTIAITTYACSEWDGAYWGPIAISPDGTLLASPIARRQSDGRADFLDLWRLPEACRSVDVHGLWMHGHDHIDVSASTTLCGLDGLPGGVLFSPSGRLLVARAYGRSCVWMIPLTPHSGNHPALVLDDGWVGPISIAPDSATLAIGRKGGVDLLSLPAGCLTTTLNYTAEVITNLSVSPDGSFLVMCGLLRSRMNNWLKPRDPHTEPVLVWHLPEGRLACILSGFEKADAHWVFTRDGRLLIASPKPNTLSLWRLPEGEPYCCVDTANISAGEVDDIAISPDDSLLVASHDSGTVSFWRLPDLEPIGSRCLAENRDDSSQNIKRQAKGPRHIQFSPDGSFLAWHTLSVIQYLQIPFNT